MDTRKIIRGAIKAIKERGHTKGALFDENGAVCLAGALNVAHHGDPTFCYPSDDYMNRAVRKLGFKTYLAAVKWNNAPKRRVETVLARLGKAA